MSTVGSDPYIIHGRPDFHIRDFGITEAKRFPPFVFSIRGGALVHRVRRVRIRWYEVGGRGEFLVKQNKPRSSAQTVCGQWFRLEAKASRTCNVPNPDALLCGRCFGEPATFGPRGKATQAGISKRAAGVKLGCVVAGY